MQYGKYLPPLKCAKRVLSTKKMLGIVNGEYMCPDSSQIKGPATTYKKLLSIDVYLEKKKNCK